MAKRGLFVGIESVPHTICELGKLGWNKSRVVLVRRFQVLFQQDGQGECVGKARNNP